MNIRVDIIKEAAALMRGGDSAVETARQVILEAGEREKLALQAAGLTSQSDTAESLVGARERRLRLAELTESPAVLTEDMVRDLCIRYRLRLLPSYYYKGGIDPVLGAKLVRFMDAMGVSIPSDMPGMTSLRDHLFVMAPMEAFDLTLAHRNAPVTDPVLFYRTQDGLYSMVHKWGSDFTVARRIQGWFTATALRWRTSMFLAILAVHGCGMYLFPEHFNFKMGDMPVGTSVIVALVILRFLLLMDVESWRSRRTFSDQCWDQPERTDRPIWFQ